MGQSPIQCQGCGSERIEENEGYGPGTLTCRDCGDLYEKECPPHDFDVLRQCRKCGLGSVRRP